MKVAEALKLIRQVGVVENSGGHLRLRFPERERTALQPAIDALRSGKAEALALLAGPLSDQGVPWAQWKAAALNQLFQEQGTSRQPGQITAATVSQSMRPGKK